VPFLPGAETPACANGATQTLIHPDDARGAATLAVAHGSGTTSGVSLVPRQSDARSITANDRAALRSDATAK